MRHASAIARLKSARSIRRVGACVPPTRICLSLAAVALLPLVPPAAADELNDSSGPICWTKEALDAKAGEEKVQQNKHAFVDLPSGQLESFEPLRRGGAVRRVRLPPEKKLIALTFDLCEQPHEITGYQGMIVDYLRKHEIKATFFAGGKWMLSHPERAQQLMSDPLFEVGNHTWGHRNLRGTSGDTLKNEIERAQLAYENIRHALEKKQCLARDGQPAVQRAPRRMDLFRFPFGACDDQALDAVDRAGLTAIQWDVSSGDPAIGLSSQHMVDDVVSLVKPGSIVLFHANGRGWQTHAALPVIVDRLTKDGFKFVTVSELLKEGEPEIKRICYDSRPGDTFRYDGLAKRLEEIHLRAEQKYARQSPPAHYAPTATTTPVAGQPPHSVNQLQQPSTPAAPELPSAKQPEQRPTVASPAVGASSAGAPPATAAPAPQPDLAKQPEHAGAPLLVARPTRAVAPHATTPSPSAPMPAEQAADHPHMAAPEPVAPPLAEAPIPPQSTVPEAGAGTPLATVPLPWPAIRSPSAASQVVPPTATSSWEAVLRHENSTP